MPKAVHVLLASTTESTSPDLAKVIRCRARALLALATVPGSVDQPDPPRTALTDLFRHQLIDHFLRAIELA